MNPLANAIVDLVDVPSHVPAALVRDFDYTDMGDEADINAFWKKLHDGPEIFFTPRQGGHWVLTRFEDVAHVMANYQDFSSEYMIVPKGSTPPRLPPLGMDPPEHTEFRSLLARFFTPRSIVNLEVRARELTRSLLDRIEGKGECEFIAEFALNMPIGIFMSLVDLPETDRLPLLDIAERLVRADNSLIRQQAYQEAYAYLAAKYEERRRRPGSDVLSILLQARVDGGRPLTQDELLNAGAVLLAGGLDTVAAQMGFTMLFLARNDAHRRRLIENPKLIPVAMEEMMRKHATANVARMVTHDLLYKGVEMKAGDMVLTPTSLANLDDRHFPDPMAVDFDRADKKSLIFGRGPHQCIGSYLARTELRVFLPEWLERIPDFRIKPGDHPRVKSGSGNTVLYLPLVWDVRT